MPSEASDYTNVVKVAGSKGEDGFTIVELLIAMMILALVMAALAPAFYGELRATAATNYRSTANGLAVAAIEDMRAFPYYQIGYNLTDYSNLNSTVMTGCVSSGNTYQSGGTANPSLNPDSGMNPVELSGGSALDNPINNLVTSQTVSGITFSITRCVYWANSATGCTAAGGSGGTNPCTAAYKLTWVGVSWTAARMPWHISQTSTIYPGGEGKYNSPGKNNATPPPGNCQNQGTVPNYPGSPASPSLTAAQDPTFPATTVDLSWPSTSQPSSTLPVQYEVEYSSVSSSGPWTVFGETGILSMNVDGLTGSTTYWFAVWTIACDGTAASTAAVAPQTTGNAAQSCAPTNFTVTPTSATINGQDKLVGGVSSFQFSVNVQSACNNVAVVYNPQNTGNVTDYAPAGSGTLSWTSSASKWSPGTLTFYLYVAGSPSGATQQVKITCNSQTC